jgi:phosphoribosylformylglycinamidine synthase subunit PurQ / glutaminase
MRFGVLRFPGSCDEVDALRAARRVGDAELIWHRDRDLAGVDAVVVPGGFSYGDYLRAGAIARFSPAMESVVAFARDGGLVLGICNGFQVLCEAGLLPGTLLGNSNRHFTCRQVEVVVVNANTAFTRACARAREDEERKDAAASPVSDAGAPVRLSIPAKHSCGRYYADVSTLATMRDRGQVVLRYAPTHNFNGSLDDIAGVCNEEGNVFGLMPHPEHAVDQMVGGSADGLTIFASMSLASERAGAA